MCKNFVTTIKIMKDFQTGFVAIIGRPNVGKSTLTNELLGQKISITSHKAQTTRHQIQVIDTTDKYQMILIDTPGMHLGENKAINSYMNRAASSSIEGVDVILWLVEAGIWRKEDARVLEHIKNTKSNVIVCVNKVDRLANNEKLLDYLTNISNKYNATDIFPMSCFKSYDINNLRTLILKYLPQQQMLFSPNYITSRSEKFVVGEFIREKLMRNLSNELPYDLTVEIEKYQNIGKVKHIYAAILIDRKSQKSIIIGTNGSMIKKISTEARLSIEGFLEQKVFLKIWVKVSSGWANDKRSLASLGYD